MTIKQLLVGSSIAVTAFGLLWLRSPHERPAVPAADVKAKCSPPKARAVASARKAPASRRHLRPWLPLKKAGSSDAQLSSRKLYSKHD